VHDVLDVLEEAGAECGAGAGAGGAGTGAAETTFGEDTALSVIGAVETTDPFDVEKMTRLALAPAGTVTTQNCAPPAPTVPPVQAFGPMVAGLHSHGIPLQFPEGQSIRTAKPGSTPSYESA